MVFLSSAVKTKFGVNALLPKKRIGTHRNLSYEEETELISGYTKESEKGHLIDVKEIEAAYIEKVGHSISSGQIYRVLRRHGWRKIMPRSKHPQKASDEAIEASIIKLSKKTNERGWLLSIRQEIMQDIAIFTSAPKAKFYDELFLNLDLSAFPDTVSKTGRKGYSKQALLCAFIADKGYDAKAIYNTVKTVYCGECNIPLNKRNSKEKGLVNGHPICEAGLSMHKDGKFSDNGRTGQKFCCPFKRSKSGECPCNHKNRNNGKKNRGCTAYVTLPDDYRLSIDCECISFKKVYALRTEAERYNSRFKQTGQERLWVQSFKAAQNLNTSAHIALLAVAYAAFITHSKLSVRCLKSAKRIA